MKRCAPTRLGGKAVATLAFQFGRDRHAITLGEIELSIYVDLIPAGEKPHLFHWRLNVDSVWSGFSRIDVVVELDPDHGLFERVIERGDPFDLERLGLAGRNNF